MLVTSTAKDGVIAGDSDNHSISTPRLV
uniref:Uncharacterized protein n=1 Tax=Anguilla anguilla TaxID=7936 RepID=A0A0E9VK04_ANGAN